MITLKNLSFKVGKNNILNGINMELQRGKVYGLLGLTEQAKPRYLKLY